MEELQGCLRLSKKINRLNERIFELRSVILSPKNQVITGMPRGSSNDNTMDKYLIKLERFEKRKEKLVAIQQEKWNLAKEKLDLSEQEEYLLYTRFVKGLPWKKVAAKINKKYGNWNLSKCFRIYNKINKIFE